MPARGRARAVAIAVLVAGLVAGCTDHGGEPLASSTTTTTRPPGEIVEGGTARLGVAGPIVVDPTLANLGSPSDLMVLDLLHDGLTRLDADSNPLAAVASEWAHDEGLITWTFTIDPTTTFASGRAVTSADVVASLERVAKAGGSLPALRLEAVQGFAAFVAGMTPNLAGLTAPDPQHVQILLDTPLSSPRSRPPQRRAVTSERWT
jgi:ABC-type transport system substrate-binding protein